MSDNNYKNYRNLQISSFAHLIDIQLLIFEDLIEVDNLTIAIKTDIF